MLALFASQLIVPNMLVPIMEILSGLLVILMGARLVWQRWAALHRNPDHDHGCNHTHGHNHSHPHVYDHSHDGDRTHAHTHDHGDGHVHSHLPPAESSR